MVITTVLITGANRGIGKGLVSAYLRKDNTIVIAACRNPFAEQAEDLHSLPCGSNSNLIIVPLSLHDPDSFIEMAQVLHLEHNISHIDVVVANAGICNHFGLMSEMTDFDLRTHLEVNTFGPSRLFRAMIPFLRASQQEAKFVYVSTELASLAVLDRNKKPLTNAYGMSMVAGNYFVRRLHFENEELVAFAIDPGFVQTDMGNRGAHAKGLEMAPLTVDQSADGIVRQIQQATKSTTSGQFLSHCGEALPW
ncbi:putative short chain-type dehydrogenase [Aspergillus avenaceus]|uniref:Putative short chain-type dehydrogenase n=1 Tax=Aspergillus avenaceus TaxID=36643 RepID=A0A5N6U187_ASPAV|nr:putative short chain-type dehydrogenase [Aspergillus avenaceus]